MKTINTKLAILAITLLTIATNTSCSKNDDAVVTPLAVEIAPLQDPLQGYLEASGFNQVTNSQINQSDIETGYSFTPLVSGKIRALVVKIPDTNSNLRVTIWDKVTGGIIRTEFLNVTTANTEFSKSITTIDLLKDKEYVISMKSNDYYFHKRTDNLDATYPFIIGDLKITSYNFGGGTQQIIPVTGLQYVYRGLCSFKFQK